MRVMAATSSAAAVRALPKRTEALVEGVARWSILTAMTDHQGETLRCAHPPWRWRSTGAYAGSPGAMIYE